MDVLQRMGPMSPPRTAVAPLERRSAATVGDAVAMRRAFRAWVGRLTDPDTADDLALAVYEALANVVDHAYDDVAERGGMALHAIASRPLLTGRDVVVTIVDEGHWRGGHDVGWRGRGLPLMRELARTTSVLTGEGGTVVQFRHRVAPAQRSSSPAPAVA